MTFSPQHDNLWWVRTQIDRDDVRWHIGYRTSEGYPGSTYGSFRRLCQPAGERFRGIVWRLGGLSRFGGKPDRHPMHPAAAVRLCARCLAATDPNTVSPRLPTEEQFIQWQYEDAVKRLSTGVRQRPTYEDTTPAELSAHAAAIEGTDADLAADLRRLADDYVKALALLLDHRRKEIEESSPEG